MNSKANPAQPSTVTMITDFGLKDPFVGVMKGVMLSINPQLTFVDLSHLIEPQNICQAAYVLLQAYSYFPKGTIHLVVVDPGVGTKRKAIIAETENSFFVGPDNGVLSAILQKRELKRVVAINEDQYMQGNVSSTFHGRDVFAPVAARLSCGEAIERFGPKIDNYCKRSFPEPKYLGENTIKAEVVYVDHFGNLVTNLREGFTPFEKNVMLSVLNFKINGLKVSYEAAGSEPSAIFNSWGMLEIFLKNKNAAKELCIPIGAEVICGLF